MLGEDVSVDSGLEGIPLRFFVDVEADVGVIEVVCSEFWAYGSAEAGV